MSDEFIRVFPRSSGSHDLHHPRLGQSHLGSSFVCTVILSGPWCPGVPFFQKESAKGFLRCF